jgi:hypothetical protein
LRGRNARIVSNCTGTPGKTIRAGFVTNPIGGNVLASIYGVPEQSSDVKRKTIPGSSVTKNPPGSV